MGCTVGKEDVEAGKIDVNTGSCITILPSSSIFHPPTEELFKGIDQCNDISNVPKSEAKVDNSIKQPKYKTKIDSRVTSKYEIKALIGKGSFSDVLRVDCKLTKQPFAIKIIKVRNEQEEDLLNAELAVLKSFSHRYIMHLEEVIMSKECTYLIMELATGGELYDRIKSRGHLDEAYSCNITQMILEGILYLHSHGIAHRDLKPENLLFYHPGRDSKILITDFGFSKIKSHSIDFSMTTWCGTPEYIAPELLKKVPYCCKVDLWAIGVIVYVMLSGHLPFSADTTPKLFKQIINCNYTFLKEIWNTVSVNAKDFICKLLVADPMERLDANDALSHPWIKSQPPLHKRNIDLKTTQRRLQTRHRRNSRLTLDAPITKHIGNLVDDGSSLMSDSTWTNYMKTKASPLHKRQRTMDKNIVIPLGFQNKIVTKEKILGDQESTLTPSNIDSVLATEDSNSQVSSQFGVLQMYYYKNMISAETEEEKQRAAKEYADYMKANEMKLPLKSEKDNNVSDNGIIIPNVGSLKQHKISMHDQFENIDEDSEDGLNSKELDLNKFDRFYSSQGGTANSIVSVGSFKSTHIPVEVSNASYIEKVGVWLNEENNPNEGFNFNQDKYKISDMDSLLSNRRTLSQKSNLTTSDHSQASFNRVVLAPQKKMKIELMHTQSYISNATSTTDLLPPSLKPDAFNGDAKDTFIDMSPEGSFQPLIYTKSEA